MVRKTNYKFKLVLKMKNFKHIFIIILLCLGFESYSQIAVTGYSNYALGLNTSKEKVISFEMKIFTNHYVEDIPIEGNVFYNFKTKEYHRFSIGLGINLSPFSSPDQVNSFVIPIVLEIFPIKDFKKIAIVFELTPELRIEDDVNIRSLFGIRYTFDKKIAQNFNP
jgi:hypothetical protein